MFFGLDEIRGFQLSNFTFQTRSAFVAAVAHRAILGFLAGAEPLRSVFGGLVFERAEFRALVRAVAEGLGFAQATRAPPIGLAGCDVDGDGIVLRGCGFGHGDLSSLMFQRPRPFLIIEEFVLVLDEEQVFVHKVPNPPGDAVLATKTFERPRQ